MPDLYRTDVILAPAGTAAGEVDRINRVLDAAGLGAALRPPVAAADNVAVLPVSGADPLAIREQVRLAHSRGEDLPELTPDFQYAVDTLAENPQERDWYWASGGRRIGHGAFAWLSAPRYEMTDPSEVPWRPDRSPPVIALLDTGVDAHDWLPEPWQDVPFHVDATEAHGWRPPLEVPGMAGGDGQPDPTDQQRRRAGGFFGHGTFIAGIIRTEAPSAQVLSLRVMDDDGRASVATTAHALDWLADREVDVVLMAFGCRPGDVEDDHEPVRAALRRLAQRSRPVPVVASAGNHGSEEPVFPAAFATCPDLSVISVGAQVEPSRRAPFSNYGPWVREWRNGTNVVSLMPLTTATTDGDGYAWWSGTSFAAARYAAELAVKLAHQP